MYTSDQDGKSKTASAADQEHYPEQNEVEEPDSFPAQDRVAARAFALWHARGCPHGSAERDWLQAEAELQAELDNFAPGGTRQTGSVQH
jgi:hypothetical protein